MPITWTGVSHFFASVFHDVVVGARAVANHEAQVDKAATDVEEVTAAVGAVVPSALVALDIERLAMACFGEFCALVHGAGNAAKAATVAPDADKVLLGQIETILQQNPQIVVQAKVLFGAK